MTESKRYKKIITVVDSNNFYVSCERLFQPNLNNYPVIVLSNNDGCVIARSEEVKKLNIPVGAPIFKYKELIDKYNIVIKSSNYELYGDISQRIVDILKMHFEDVEIYSVDECFIDLTNFKPPPKTSLTKYLITIRKKILQWTGIPVSIGVGNSKTLAKVANRIVKKTPNLREIGVFNMSISNEYNIEAETRLEYYLKSTPIEDVWGIGKNLVNKLTPYGINNALDFLRMDSFFIRNKWSVTLQRTQLELKGNYCFAVNSTPSPRQMIMSTRSFGRSIIKLDELEAAVSTHAHKVSEKLRQFGLVAGELSVFLKTNKHSPQTYIKLFDSTTIIPHSNNLRLITKVSLKILRKIYSDKLIYTKAGVIVTKTQPIKDRQMSITHEYQAKFDPLNELKKEKLDHTIDLINARWGRGSIKLASSRTISPWKSKSSYRSPSYTTRWEDLPIVY